MSKKATTITGGVGLMGSHLVGELLEYRYKVIILDNLSAGRVGNIRLLMEPSWHYEQSEESPLQAE